MRLASLLPVLAVAALAGCGSDGDSPPPPPVQVQITVPDDEAEVREDSVELRGRVEPADARVTVRGQAAPVQGGEFSARVPLTAGTNVIDVLASAGRARPATTAIRVSRKVTVQVPAVTGLTPEEAEEQLTALGLEVDQQTGGSIIDEILGGQPTVCDSEPAAGAQVEPGTTVTIQVRRSC